MVRRFSKFRLQKHSKRRVKRSKRLKSKSREMQQHGSCSISYDQVLEWDLKNEDVENLYKYLYDNIEHGGKLTLDTHRKSTSQMVKSNSGKKDSVDAPDAIVNWHTHPVSCYLGEKTIWGWPSGEDMRETIVFGLRGSACHLVPSVEGVYLIQPNPCVISSLINIDIPRDKFSKIAAKVSMNDWDSFLRGLIILAIEIYFRSTHVFRTVEYIGNYPNTTAYDFVDFTNAFKLENMFHKSEIEGCSREMKCNQIQQFENQRVSNISLRKYVKDYEYDTKIYLISKNGDSRSTSLTFYDVLKMGGLKLLKKLMLGSDCVFPIKKWHTGRMFLMRLYPNQVRINHGWVDYSSLTNEERWNFLEMAQADSIRLKHGEHMKFYLFDMKGNCDYSHLKQHIKHFSTRGKHEFGENKNVEVIGSEACKYCVMAKKRAEEKNINVKFHYFGTIVEAIQAASDKAGQQVDSIPAYFKDGVYSKDPLF